MLHDQERLMIPTPSTGEWGGGQLREAFMQVQNRWNQSPSSIKFWHRSDDEHAMPMGQWDRTGSYLLDGFESARTAVGGVPVGPTWTFVKEHSWTDVELWCWYDGFLKTAGTASLPTNVYMRAVVYPSLPGEFGSATPPEDASSGWWLPRQGTAVSGTGGPVTYAGMQVARLLPRDTSNVLPNARNIPAGKYKLQAAVFARIGTGAGTVYGETYTLSNIHLYAQEVVPIPSTYSIEEYVP